MPGLFNWGGRKEAPPAASPPAVASDPRSVSKVLPRFLSALSQIESPVLLNIGPVIGQNVSFFGEQLSCKIFVEDLFAEVEAHTKRGALDQLPRALDARLSQSPGSIDGVLCWDLFDFLDRPTSKAVAARLVGLLRPGGVLYGFFGTTAAEMTSYTRFVVEGPDTLRMRTAPAPPTRRNVMVTRDINKMFEGLVVAESVLLKSCTRETLFRKA